MLAPNLSALLLWPRWQISNNVYTICFGYNLLRNKFKLYVKRGSLRPGACFRLLSRRKNMTLVMADKEYLFRSCSLNDGMI
jgi:hypothetical protein